MTIHEFRYPVYYYHHPSTSTEFVILWFKVQTYSLFLPTSFHNCMKIKLQPETICSMVDRIPSFGLDSGLVP